MLASFLAAFFFALNATCASHSIRAHGVARANFGRLLVATVVLAAFAHTLGHGFTSASTGWFLLSGVIGMGLGDLGQYGALPLLGSRITVLMTQCLAAPIAALGEWLWLGTTLTPAQIACGLVILAGVAIAIAPSKTSPPRVRVRPIGFLFGLLAAAGQGLGALVSRKGVVVAEAASESVHNVTFGLTAAYQRIIAGFVFVIVWYFALRVLGRGPATASAPPATAPSVPSVPSVSSVLSPAAARSRETRGYWWTLANGLAGPVIAVSCYQWALATTPSGIVLPIAAIAPLLAIPIAMTLEGDRPPRRAIFGGFVAVAGCVVLARIK